ncbi:MAG: hypothetical protein L6U16_01925 [Porphyromonadaceae bacterium]|nr:MAG: hypothetical protein L6U16_01925 [Porphyromonadaceae bacterium]
MLAVLALVSFVPMLYEEDWTMSRCVIHAIAELSSFIAALYIVSFFCSVDSSANSRNPILQP